MAKLNVTRARPATFSPIKTSSTPSGRTHQGGPGFSRDEKSELFLLGLNFFGEGSFYETAQDRDHRFILLVHHIAATDPEWMVGYIGWLRGTANIRTAAVVAAAEMVRARTARKLNGYSRQAVNAACQRADEPGEMLAYWHTHYGRRIPKPLKRGLADAALKLYNQRALLKYDSAERGVRFADVIELVRPRPEVGWQSALFKHAIDRRHNRGEEIPENLDLLRLRSELLSVQATGRRALLKLPNSTSLLREAGMTWESLAGWLQGPMDKDAWEAIIPSMGVMALIRNLRNFDQAGISDKAAQIVISKITDPEEIKRSKALPMRFLAAYQNAPSLRWSWPLEQGLNHTLANVPSLPGKTLILVDRSGSMFDRMSSKSDLTRADSAAIFGSALALRAEKADLVQFGTRSEAVKFSRGDSVLKMLNRFYNMGGTDTPSAVTAWYRNHDRVIVITDEQTDGYYRSYYRTADPFGNLPAHVPTYTWNLAGYEKGHAPSGSGNRHTFGSLNDSSFGMVPLLESCRDGAWPWLNEAA